jgi:hypothetical protein
MAAVRGAAVSPGGGLVVLACFRNSEHKTNRMSMMRMDSTQVQVDHTDYAG